MIAEERWFIASAGELDMELPDMVRDIATLRGSNRGHLLVARVDGRVAGYLVLRAPPWRRTSHVVKLEILVDARYRGEGVGRALLQAGIAWAESAPGIEKIGLSVFADNERALALYRSLGFQEEGRRLREYRMDDGTYRDDVLLYRLV
ncbi:MAG: GNAT family N-acetyltransferase [Myxococcales bacterium]|nr:GNAT family N-acetyltransferase [Myxococcales bacterium]MCB9670191.1 GNAT family N-acetyltransferase [Alphaproteobacteria bacterium]MCB9695045.1 GNAT family N-acetyltransferase [Alphaproteobacteria bacterium]